MEVRQSGPRKVLRDNNDRDAVSLHNGFSILSALPDDLALFDRQLPGRRAQPVGVCHVCGQRQKKGRGYSQKCVPRVEHELPSELACNILDGSVHQRQLRCNRPFRRLPVSEPQQGHGAHPQVADDQGYERRRKAAFMCEREALNTPRTPPCYWARLREYRMG